MGVSLDSSYASCSSDIDKNIIVRDIFNLIDEYEVTHFGGAPIVLNMIANAPKEDQKTLKNKIYVMTAGGPRLHQFYKKWSRWVLK